MLPRRIMPAVRLLVGAGAWPERFAARAVLARAGCTLRRVRAHGDLLQHAIDAARDGMAILDRDLRLIAWNRAFVAMFEMPDALMRVGTGVDMLIRSGAERGIYGRVDVDEFVSARLERLLEPADRQRITLVSPRGDALGRVLELHSVRLRDGGMFLTYADATARAQSEEELEAENVTLEHRVRERTEELQSLNFELLRAKAEAEDANISKTRFLAAASHDLLQPLNAARLYTTALREQLRRAGAPDFDRLVTNVDLSLEAVEEILGALLEISQLDAGATQAEVSVFPIGDLLRQLAMEFEPLAHERGLRLTVMPCSLLVRSDRKLLRRLLQNLISNALKYTPRGRVLVGARRIAGRLRLDVVDTGVGIPAGKRRTIFREFERLPQAMGTTAGAGLGLSIVERLGQVLNHEVTLVSTLGRGSAFRVGLPVARGTLAGRRSAAPRPAPRSLAGLTVAAIDNEADILSGMETLLKGWDCTVITGTDLPRVEAALSAAQARPDVIVADFHVGDLDGLDIIAALRRRHGQRPAVLITADRDRGIRHRALAADVLVLNKPLKPAALRSLLTQWQLVADGRPRDAAPERDRATLLG